MNDTSDMLRMRRLRLPMLVTIPLVVFLAAAAAAQDDAAPEAPRAGDEALQEEQQPPPIASSARPQQPRTIEDILENSERIDGLFTVYRDRKTGELRLLLDDQALDRTYLYFTYTENGVPAAGHFRGAFGVSSARVFRLARYFDRIEFVIDNASYYFDPSKPIARAANANVSHAVVFTEKIEAEDAEGGRVLIKANGLFLAETFTRVAPLPNPERRPQEIFSLGRLSLGKSKIVSIRNYPENTDVVVEYVYENERPYVRGGDEVTDPRFVSLVIQHSLIAAPDDEFQPRFDDPRVGYFMEKITDLSSTDVTPYRDVISRWNLVKKDSSAAMSEPVKPIVFWIENTTPMELRPIIEQAALRWNEAFETAGFRNAIVVRTQPDDAEWDAGNLRYNVIRWVSSPSPQFMGYGPSFFDPRTGQILGASIILEHAVIANSLRDARVFGQDVLDAADPLPDEPHRCTAGLLAHRELMFGLAALEALGADDEEPQRLLEEFIHFLVLHEIGHTLGLNHNFRSSHLHSLESIFDSELTYATGLHGSVMDYPVVPFALPGEPQPQFFITRPGPYDRWAIEFGYSPALPDAAAEAVRLSGILARSTEPALAFGNDADDMRAPGRGIDPRAMANDMTSDPIGFARHQMAVVDAAVPRFGDRLLRDGRSYQELLNGFSTAVNRYRSAARVASRFIGGVYVDRAMVNQPGATSPLTPVALADQRRAMQLLRDKVFAPQAFAAFEPAADRLLAQRRGFDHFSTTEDPKLHAVAIRIQRDALDHLLHPTVLNRLTDTRVYGNEYSVAAMLADLTDAIFAEDLGRGINTFRQNLQLDYVTRLLAIVQPGGGPYDYVSRSIALDRLRWIERHVTRRRAPDPETAAHLDHMRYLIQRSLDGPRG